MLPDLTHKSEADRLAALRAEFTAVEAAAVAGSETAQTAAEAAQAAAEATLTDNAFTVATLPAAASSDGRMVYCSDGSAGSPCAAISDGTNWKVIAIGATVSAT